MTGGAVGAAGGVADGSGARLVPAARLVSVESGLVESAPGICRRMKASLRLSNPKVVS